MLNFEQLCCFCTEYQLDVFLSCSQDHKVFKKPLNLLCQIYLHTRSCLFIYCKVESTVSLNNEHNNISWTTLDYLTVVLDCISFGKVYLIKWQLSIAHTK